MKRSWKFGKTETLAFAALLVGLGVFVFAYLGSSERTRSIGAEVSLIEKTQQLLSTLLSLESSERGYVLTGTDAFRAPYDAAIATIDGEMSAVAERFAASSADTETLPRLRETVAAQTAFAAEVVRVRAEQGFDAANALVQQGTGRELMDAVRLAVSTAQADASLRIDRLAADRSFYGLLSALGFGSAVLAALALATLALRRQADARRSQGVLDAILANAPVGIGFVDSRLEARAIGARNRPSAVLEQLPLKRPDVDALLRDVLGSDRATLNVELDGADADRKLVTSLFPLRLDADPRQPADGVGYVVLDVTERAEAERRAREIEGRYRSLVEATAAIVWSASSSGRFDGDQPSWTSFTGQSEAEYAGFGWTQAIHPDDRERSATAWSEATRDNKPYSIEHRMRRADGQWREMLANAVPIFVAGGTVREWIGTHTDITEMKETAALLRETNSQFQALADNIPQLAWMARPDGRIFWYNRRWFDYTGRTLQEMRDFGWVDVHHPDHAERVRAGYEAALAAGRDWEDTFPLRGADGSYRWFLSQAVPIRGDEGRILRWFGTNTDVTRQREQERELETAKELAENANRAKSQFIANMSHELRTPLTAVIGYAEMLEEEVEDMGEKHLLADLGKINSNARHLLSLINDVLDLSKIEAERMETYPETFAVPEALADIASTVGSLMEKKNNTLRLDLSEDLGEAHTDQVKLRQCLINLLSNASKFTENGTITLQARRERQIERDWLVFDVIDEGIGMSPEQLQKLFQRFTQADASTTRKFGGTGLGLAITKAFCKLLGGDIAVRSREGEGSTFTIKLPALITAGIVEQPTPQAVSTDERRASAGVILTIDDDPNARDLVSRYLTRQGFLVRGAPDGLAGLELARTLRPDAILLDVTMPRMDGWSVLTALKADADLSRIPVVMLTVIDEHSLGYALGASDYLLKPVEWEQLRRVVDRYRTRDDALVLAVDDDEDLLGRTRLTLEREGFKVMTAGNGKLALAELDKGTPDLILTDLVMPEMDGFAFIRGVRQRSETARTPIVVLTSKDLTRDEFRRLRSDTEQVLSKHEVELEELAAQLRVIVSPGDKQPAANPISGSQPEPIMQEKPQ